MCARCFLIWEVEELKDKLEDLGEELGCWFDVDVTDDLFILWRAYKDVGRDSVEILSNGERGCNIRQFEEDVAKMPEIIKKVLIST